MSKYGPWAVVIGAGQGLGAEFCRRLAARGLHLVMVALEDAELRELAETLEGRYGIQARVVVGDITTEDVLARLAAITEGLEVGLVVYNAALSIRAPWLEVPLQRQLAAVDLNVRGPLILLDRYVPAMVARGRGGVILLSSMSALQGSPLLATYAATKAFTLNLAETLWEEWRPYGVDVTALVPGPTDTPGYRASAPRDTRMTPPPMPVEQAVTAALGALGKRPWVIPGRTNKIAGLVLSRLLPRKAAVGFMGRTMRAMYGRPDG